MITANRLTIGQHIRFALPGTEEMEWEIVELNIKGATIRHDGFHSQFLLYSDIAPQQVVKTEFDEALSALLCKLKMLNIARDTAPVFGLVENVERTLRR